MDGRSGQAGDGQGGAYVRLLGTFDATMLVAGSMIGSGIFIVSADIVREVGSAGGLLAVWLASGLMTVGGARCYAELATMHPHAGGQYVFLREAFGPLAGFLYGWTLLLVIQTGTIAAVAVAFAKFLAVLVPVLGADTVIATTGLFRVDAQQMVAVLVIALLSWANAHGVATGKRIQNVMTVTKVASLAALILLGLVVGLHGGALRANLAAPFDTSRAHGAFLGAFGAAMVGALFSSDAWNNVTFTAAEVRDPERTVPRALLLGTGLVVVLYLLTNVAYLAVLPAQGTAGGATALERGIAHAIDDRVGTAVVGEVLGPSAAAVMAVLVMISTFGCVNGLVLAGPRLYHAMAVDGLLFAGVARLSARGVPARALALQGVWASVLALSGRYGQLLDYVIATALLFYALTVVGLLRLRARHGHAAGSRVLSYAYVAAASAVCIDLLIVRPEYTWPGFVLVAIGFPVYLVWRRRS
ncbi:MAG: amino acid permease [Deltaproteobacteria bacterium]|nr:amino acid permease [Deltaproteobacteria bacterium]